MDSHKHDYRTYIEDTDIVQNMKGNEDEYNKGFFVSINYYGNTHIYLLYLCYREGKEW